MSDEPTKEDCRLIWSEGEWWHGYDDETWAHLPDQWIAVPEKEHREAAEALREATALIAAVREATLPCDGDLVYSGHGGALEYMPDGPSCGVCPNCKLRKMADDE